MRGPQLSGAQQQRGFGANTRGLIFPRNSTDLFLVSFSAIVLRSCFLIPHPSCKSVTAITYVLDL